MLDKISEAGRDRLVQVFEYLKALNEHRNPAIRHIDDQPWHMWLDRLPDHHAIERITPLVVDAPDDPVDAPPGSPEDEFLLRVRRPKLTKAPTPPVEIRTWLKDGWEDPGNGEVHCREFANEIDAKGDT